MVDILSIEIPPNVLRLVPKETALTLLVLPVSVESDVVTIAVPEDCDEQLLSDLAFLIDKKLRYEKASPDELLRAIKEHYGVTSEEIRASSKGKPRSVELISLNEDVPKSGEHGSSDGSVVPLVNRVIADAIRMGASDIHVESYERDLRVRYRLDGVLHEILRPPFSQAKSLISRLKIMADLDIAEKRRPQDGRIRVKEADRAIDIRVSSLPTDFGEKIVLRILDKSQLQLDLAKLGFENEDLTLFERTVQLPYGMILVTGPTGSGKTTTLYAALNFINRPEINITTIEDPIEYNLHGINQTHVRSEIGLTFAAVLRSILRQDPNVIMVGEIRDAETAEIAIRASLTGHLVLSTLHTNDAPSAITRLIDMGVEPFLVASSVRMILAQRLLRRLCSACKQPSPAGAAQIGEISAHPGVHPDAFFEGKGCPECNSLGYRGRLAVYEVLSVQNGLSSLIAKGASASEIRSRAIEAGMLTLREAGLRKAQKGETSLAEVLRETIA
jgi:type IV pilus assembly protein PilB